MRKAWVVVLLVAAGAWGCVPPDGPPVQPVLPGDGDPGDGPVEPPPPPPDGGERDAGPGEPDAGPPDAGRPDAGPGEPPPDAGPPLRFQPGYAGALRHGLWVEQDTTFRLVVPVTRTGGRVRLHLLAGPSGAASVLGVRVSNGRTSTTRVRFGGQEKVELVAKERVVSDPVAIEVRAGEDLRVTFAVRGNVAATQDIVRYLPGGTTGPGVQLGGGALSGATAWSRALLLAAVEVEGAESPALITLGDSITEAFIDGADDVREAWPSLASASLDVPVANAAVSGGGVETALEKLDAEVLPLVGGVTDCVVLLGANNVWRAEGEEIAGHLRTLVGRLKPHCRVWLGTVTPREKVCCETPIATAQRRIRELNHLILQDGLGAHGVVDFSSVVRSPSNPDLWGAGMDEDGVHPNEAGHARMAAEAARVLAPTVQAPP
jgi:lysophospholipase L1-like esterase